MKRLQTYRHPASDRLLRLVQPSGGLFGRLLYSEARQTEPAVLTRIALLNDLNHLVETSGRNLSKLSHVAGASTSIYDSEATFLSLVEALERYCSCLYEEKQLIWATADELGTSAVDLHTIPRCSATELSSQRCSLLKPVKDQPIRWVRGLSLTSGRVTYIPAVMVYLTSGYASAGEHICHPISTGCAAHITFHEAIINGLCEVIERDATAIVWLQQLRLSHVEVDVTPATLAPYWKSYLESSPESSMMFLDATTDLGIPTIYGIQRSPQSSRLATLVACATSTNPASAVAKVIRDIGSLRVAMNEPLPIPESPDDCTGLLHGAAFMARRERMHAFRFLTERTSVVSLSAMMTRQRVSSQSGLRFLIEQLRKKNLDAFVVDLTTDEALRSGMRVVKVIVPGLQPLSFNHNARFLAHPRLYDAPALMGQVPLKEEDLNPWPQPFA